MQRLELIVALMLARHRQAPTDAAGSVRPVGFATAFLSLPSGLLAIICEAIMKLGHYSSQPGASVTVEGSLAPADLLAPGWHGPPG